MKTVYLTIGIDGKRYEKIAEDGSCVGEYRFSRVASAHVLLNRMLPYLE